ncbi:Arb2 domain-containing protein [Annulohypoxylon bovei var. microspora]|nr:Arb2 domain-containing protein [Annulohypoxylon bovei var. microspora]
MFRRKWSGLPTDPDFPSDLKQLGYFINEVDEVRAIDKPENYFKFFLNRNPRWNERQRFAMNLAVQGVIWERLENLGLKKELLPLGTQDPSDPHVPIFVSKDIASKSRVVIIFGETSQDLGVLAHRVIGGVGGVSKGSMVSIVSSLLKQSSSSTDLRPPGIILANTGELLWWPEGGRTLGRVAFDAVRMQSAVQSGNMITGENMVPGNGTMMRHISYMFSEVIPHFVNDAAGIDVIGVGDGADLVEVCLDYLIMEDNWKNRINCLALVGGLYPVWELKNKEFAKEFLRNKARAYATSLEPAGMVLSGPDGNPKTTTFTNQGCPVYSSGEPHYIEMTLITAHDLVLDWLQEVAMTSNNEEYLNPEYHVVFRDPAVEDDPDWSQWQNKESTGDGENGESEEVKAEGDPEELAKDEGKGKAVAEAPRLVLVERPKAEQAKKGDAENGESEDEN